MNAVLVVEVSRCVLARGTLLGEHVLALILRMMVGNLLKTVSNWAGLTRTGMGVRGRDERVAAFTRS